MLVRIYILSYSVILITEVIMTS